MIRCDDSGVPTIVQKIVPCGGVVYRLEYFDGSVIYYSPTVEDFLKESFNEHLEKLAETQWFERVHSRSYQDS